MKLYICHPISTTGEFNDSIRVAERIKDIYRTKEITTEEDDVMGTVNEPKYDVYAPALNKEINDKSNNPTPQMIYEQDVENLLSADVVVINYTSGRAHGTLLEIGLLAGMYESAKKEGTLPKVFVYSSNKRMLQPQFWNGIASEGGNHMVFGAIEKHFTWCENEDDVIQKLRDYDG